MRRFLFITAALAAVAMVGSPTMNANAQTTRGALAIKGATQNFTPVPLQKAACGPFWGQHCGPFHHWVCGPRGRRCWCAPC